MTGNKVTFISAGGKVEVIQGDLPHGHGVAEGCLLDVAIGGGVEIEHACGGVGVCGTCHVIVKSGAGNLSEPDDDELDVIDAAPGNTLASRLACKAIVNGDVTVEIPAWNRNAVTEGG